MIVEETLHEIFSFCLQEEPTIIIIENMNWVDEESSKVLLRVLAVTQSKSLLVCSAFIKTLIDFNGNLSIDESDQFSLGSEMAALLSMDSITGDDKNLPWNKKIRRKFNCLKNNVILFSLGQLNLEDIQSKVARCLASSSLPPLEVQSLATSLSQLVFDLSGGNSIFVDELMQLIDSIGPIKFIIASKTFTNHSKAPGNHRMRASFLYRSRSDEGPASTAFFWRRNSVELNIKPSNLQSNKGSSFLVSSIIEEDKNKSIPFVPQTFLELFRAPTRSKTVQLTAHEQAKSMLDSLIITRFEVLTQDEQLILRTASLIGYQLPGRKAKSIMASSLVNFIKNKWIVESQSNLSDPPIDFETYQESSSKRFATNLLYSQSYVFHHEMLYRTILNLTPQSSQISIHKTLAELVEAAGRNKLEDDSAYCLFLAKHYNLCNADKSFEYCIKSSLLLLTPTSLDVSLVLIIITNCGRHCKAMSDVKVILFVLNRLISILRDIQCANELESQQKKLADDLIDVNQASYDRDEDQEASLTCELTTSQYSIEVDEDNGLRDTSSTASLSPNPTIILRPSLTTEHHHLPTMSPNYQHPLSYLQPNY